MQKVQLKNSLRQYASEICDGIEKTDFSALSEIVDVLLEAKRSGTKIFTIGNGGSSATASHICNDLLKGCSCCGRPGFITECLCDSTAVLTCLSNDFDYESVFSIQLRTKAKNGDVLLAFSGSGNSPNVIKGLEEAKRSGVKTIGFSGRTGGKMKDLCDIIIIAPTYSMEQIEDYHMMYAHALTSTLAAALTAEYSSKS